jgi:hypothetical protein
LITAIFACAVSPAVTLQHRTAVHRKISGTDIKLRRPFIRQLLPPEPFYNSYVLCHTAVSHVGEKCQQTSCVAIEID